MDMIHNKKVLVTGATGLLGSNLVYRLMSTGDNEIFIMGRSKLRMEAVFSDLITHDSFHIIEHDVSESIPALGDFDLIFHAAGPIAGKIIKETPVKVIMPNIQGAMNCLNYLNAQTKKGRMIVFSSATVYANTSEEDKIVSEDDTSVADALHAPNAPYSESKRMVEVIANAYQKQYAMDVVVARFGYIYGYTKQVPDTAFYSFIKKAINGENIELNNPNAPKRDNIYVSDAVDGLISLALCGKPGEAYNISSGGDKQNFAAIDEISVCIQNAVNELIPNNHTQVILATPKTNRAPGICLSNAKLKGLGWKLSTSLAEGVYETVKMYIKS